MSMNIFKWIWAWIKSWWATPPVPILLYESYYPLNTVKETISETEENITQGQVEDETPEGKVVMKYKDDLFLYWSDKPIMYRYLETVARKYVIVHDCKEVYVNMYRELIKSLQEQETVVNGPYAQFKSYNSSMNRVKPKLVRERSNHYKYMGKWEVPKSTMPFKPINFLEYKRKNV